jgi:hypothetical protein
MAEKTVTLILLQADRQLWAGEPARLQVTDVSRPQLKVLFNERLQPNSSTVLINLDLLFDAGQVYGISVDVKKHRSAWQLIHRRTFLRQQGTTEVEVKDTVMRLMLVPHRPSSSDLDQGYERLRDRGSPMVADTTGLSQALYRQLERRDKPACCRGCKSPTGKE